MFGFKDNAPKAERHPRQIFNEAIDAAIAAALRANQRPDLLANGLEQRVDGLRNAPPSISIQIAVIEMLLFVAGVIVGAAIMILIGLYLVIKDAKPEAKPKDSSGKHPERQERHHHRNEHSARFAAEGIQERKRHGALIAKDFQRRSGLQF